MCADKHELRRVKKNFKPNRRLNFVLFICLFVFLFVFLTKHPLKGLPLSFCITSVLMHVFLDCFIVKSADPDKALYIDVNFLVILLNDTKT